MGVSEIGLYTTNSMIGVIHNDHYMGYIIGVIWWKKIFFHDIWSVQTMIILHMRVCRLYSEE